jgi:predicted alpha/beta superfamily hydrolase
MRLDWLRRALAAWSVCVVIAGVSACGGGGGGGGGGASLPIVALPPAGSSTPTQPAASTNGRVVSDFVTSSSNGVRYPVDVFIPASYDAGTDAFPVIYALDGDATNGLPDTRFTNLKNVLIKRGTKSLLVGIGNTARRQEDYNFPGANKYHAFLAQDLVPFIEAKYRSDPKKRMLTGLSTSGNLAATALFLEAPDNLVFSYFVSIEAAFWQQRDDNFALEKKMFDALAGRPLPVTLILAHCESGCNQDEVRAMYQRMAARNYAGLTLLDTSFPSTHVGTDVLAFDDAISRIFK